MEAVEKLHSVLLGHGHGRREPHQGGIREPQARRVSGAQQTQRHFDDIEASSLQVVEYTSEYLGQIVAAEIFPIANVLRRRAREMEPVPAFEERALDEICYNHRP